MRQTTLATSGFDRYSKPTQRAVFLAEMDHVVPWRQLCALIEPVYPKPGKGRSPVGLERMLRIYFLQQWFNLPMSNGVIWAIRNPLTRPAQTKSGFSHPGLP